MKKIIYHGSKDRIEKPIFGKGKTYNDYGLGFYCTEQLEMAKEWAVSWNHDGFANQYVLDLEGLQVLYLNDEPYCTLHWLALLLDNREFDVTAPLAIEAKEYLLHHFLLPIENEDVIIGYRADDSYFSFAQDFISGTISYRQLQNAMQLGKLGEQIVLKSKAAFQQIQFVNSEAVLRSEWLARKQWRDQNARRTYFDVERNKRQRGDLYITNILDEEMKGNETRLR